jgi:type 1 glutamine amidotransferase
MVRFPAVWLAVAFSFGLVWNAGAGAGESPKVKVLLLSGRNNHDWKATTPLLEQILQNSGRFKVDVTEDPVQSAVHFAEYEVLVSNWNNFGEKEGDWPTAAREAFLRFVRSGKGFVVVHSGSSSFPEWLDYHRIAGGAWGEGTGHGPAHTFQVKIADAAHPITRGLAAFETTDELWHREWSIAERHILATAYSAKDKGGSGADEPVAFTTS